MNPLGSRLDLRSSRGRGTTHAGATSMAIEVRIPTILRTYTEGQKSV